MKLYNCATVVFPLPDSRFLFSLSIFFLPFMQMGTNVKEFLRLVEDFVNMIGMQMSGFQDIYEVTENLGEP